ncbi:hypothetical protein CYMTET_11848 [Cymbomonas tetramitiformis]|uniref:Integrase catalytic domain-containing protein n=1 Tax=Cymbomonas tetramitiformis TaxID=36881 RepID=A0AAE0GL97_9CHLO|nr:hypothetical protein CYMTET_11848 [Cymbomonas tetramitiformis]
MYYKFSTDLAPMPRKAKCNYQYVMGVVEHFTKYVCLIPLQSKEPSETAQAFALHIIARFGCPAEESTRLSPYELVYAQRPTLPPAIKERINEPLGSCMDADVMAASYLERAEYVKRAAVMAGSNIAINMT